MTLAELLPGEAVYRGENPVYWDSQPHGEWMAVHSPKTYDLLQAAIGGKGRNPDGTPNLVAYSVEKEALGFEIKFPRGSAKAVTSAALCHCFLPEAMSERMGSEARNVFRDEDGAQYRIHYLSGSNWLEKVEYVINHGIQAQMPIPAMDGYWTLFRMLDLEAIRRGIQTGDYSGYSDPEQAKGFPEKTESVQLGYALRRLRPEFVYTISRSS